MTTPDRRNPKSPIEYSFRALTDKDKAGAIPLTKKKGVPVAPPVSPKVKERAVRLPTPEEMGYAIERKLLDRRFEELHREMRRLLSTDDVLDADLEIVDAEIIPEDEDLPEIEATEVVDALDDEPLPFGIAGDLPAGDESLISPPLSGRSEQVAWPISGPVQVNAAPSEETNEDEVSDNDFVVLSTVEEGRQYIEDIVRQASVIQQQALSEPPEVREIGTKDRVSLREAADMLKDFFDLDKAMKDAFLRYYQWGVIWQWISDGSVANLAQFRDLFKEITFRKKDIEGLRTRLLYKQEILAIFDPGFFSTTKWFMFLFSNKNFPTVDGTFEHVHQLKNGNHGPRIILTPGVDEVEDTSPDLDSAMLAREIKCMDLLSDIIRFRIMIDRAVEKFARIGDISLDTMDPTEFQEFIAQRVKRGELDDELPDQRTATRYPRSLDAQGKPLQLSWKPRAGLCIEPVSDEKSSGTRFAVIGEKVS